MIREDGKKKVKKSKSTLLNERNSKASEKQEGLPRNKLTIK